MRTKVDFAEIEKGLDFDALSRNLETLTTSGGLKRRKTVSDLLDKVKPALEKARDNKVSFQALTEFLVSSGIPVSEPTLRQYLSAGKKSKKKRNNPGVKLEKKPEAQPKPEPQKPVVTVSPVSPVSSSEPSAKKLPPRLARREQKPA
jgi:hypothetical protein